MRTTFLASLALALAVCGCSKTGTNPSGEVSQSGITLSGWIRLAARPDLPASGYFQAASNGKAGRLLAVTSPKARVEMHESMMTGNMASMKPIGPTGFDSGKLVFAPGGKHLMIYGLDPKLKPGGTVPLVFSFEGLPPMTVEARLVGPGDPAPDDAG